MEQKNFNGGKFNNNFRSDVTEVASKAVETVENKTSFFAKNWKMIAGVVAGVAVLGSLAYLGIKSHKKSKADNQSSEDTEE